ncbi:MAG: HAMP domain-containing protein, partial [Polyangiaceae bacterium]|nr:HAMP domain-containing protein [Polyangiaceae bacterium]
AQVREQYIHQAHTIINWDRSHLGHYEEAVARTRQATERLERVARAPDEARRADEVARLAAGLDRQFRREILPLVGRGERGDVAERHERTEALVGRVVELNEELSAEFEGQTMRAREREADLRSRARTIEILFFALAIVVAGVVGVLATRAVLRPISALRAGAAEIATGNLSARIAVSGRDEFAELGSSFNRMAEDLARHQRDLVQSQKLASTGQVAAGVAHEINNPLGVILGYAKLLRRDPGATGDLAEGLRIIEDEAMQCQRIVEGLLDLARPPRLQRSQVDVAELARDAVERLMESGKLEGIHVEAPTAAERAPAWGDEAKLRQVITNLLVNAAEATPATGAISIEASADSETSLLVVRDSGAGIPADVLPRVFDPFFTTKPKGTGLGLAVSQAIVEAHGGSLDLAAGEG